MMEKNFSLKKIIFFYSCLALFLSLNTLPLPSASAGEEPSENTPVIERDLSEEIKNLKYLISKNDYYSALGYITAFLKNIRGLNEKTVYDLYLMAGNSYVNIGLYSTAEQYYNDAVSINKKPVEAYLGLQKMAILQKRYKKSLEYYKKISVHAKTVEIPYASHYLAMTAYYNTNNYKKCMELSKSIPPAPSSEFFPYIQYTKALAIMKRKGNHNDDVAKALEIMNKLIDSNKYPAQFRDKIRLTVGMTMFEEGEYEISIKKLHPLTDKSLYADDALYTIIWNYIKLDRYDKAFEKMGEFISRHKESSRYEDILLLKGQLYKKTKKFKQSITSFEKAREEFSSTKNLLEDIMNKKEYIRMIISLYEVAELPVLRYYSDFILLELKGRTEKRHNEKRLLKEIAKKEYVFKSLTQLIRIRKIIDSLAHGRMKFRFFSRKFEYNIAHYKNMAKNFRKEIKNLKKINIAAVKHHIKADSSPEDINLFATQKEKFIIEEVQSELNNSIMLLEYIKSISLLLDKPDKAVFFKEIQSVMLGAPVLKTPVKSAEERINDAITKEEKIFLSGAEKERAKLTLINKNLTSMLWSVGSIMFKGEESQALYWKDSHEKVKTGVADINNLADGISRRLFIIKNNILEAIKGKVEDKKVDLEKRLRKIEKKINELEIRCSLIIKHIDLFIEEIKPMKKMMKETTQAMLWLENKNRKLLQKMRNSLKNNLLKELKNKVEVYKMLIEEAEYEIADSLFYVTTGR